MYDKLWNNFTKSYGDATGLPAKVVDYLSVLDIIRYSATGMSNSRIGSRLSLDDDYVSKLLILYLNFSGWESDLEFNPFALYKQSDGDFDRYVGAVAEKTIREYSKGLLTMSFNVAKIFWKVKEVLSEYGY